MRPTAKQQGLAPLYLATLTPCEQHNPAAHSKDLFTNAEAVSGGLRPVKEGSELFFCSCSFLTTVSSSMFAMTATSGSCLAASFFINSISPGNEI
eukprot:754794-Hanusia_phi.AAC.3